MKTLDELSERLLQLANDEGSAQIHDVAVEIAGIIANSRMTAFGASDAACYKYPDDTPEHRLARQAFCEGAASATLVRCISVNQAQEMRE